MSNRDRIHLPNDGPGDRSDESLAPKALAREEFGRRVYNAMLKKGWRQSDLARVSGVPKDSVSTYIRGKVMPTSLSLQKIAEALGVDPTDLLPNALYRAIDADTPDFEMKVSPGDGTKAWVRLNRLMSMKAAVAIATIVNDDASF